MKDPIISILLIFVGIILGIVIFYIFNSQKQKKAKLNSKKILEEAEENASKLKKEALLEAKEEITLLKQELEKESKEKKQEISNQENRLFQREQNIDKRDQTLQNKEKNIESKEEELISKNEELQKEKVKLEELEAKQLEELEKIAKLDQKSAGDIIMKKAEEKMSKERVIYMREREEEMKLAADEKSREILVACMQRYAADVASEQTITVVGLANEELKGRIIGREGRNIRTLEAITGVDLIIDDTPEAVVLSSFDPYRREVAKETLETLVKDGRIHPGRIEEVYDKVSKDISASVLKHGKDALFELGIHKMDPELIKMIGRLKFRTSYGQNALTHSIEVATFSGLIAAELGENANVAKRAGLLHDIGKSIDHEVEGSHVSIGAEMARKYNESEAVINSIESHHGEKEATSIISEIVAIADALSASRPGARNASIENYIQRLKELEAVTEGIEGVEKTFAVQAGRELRVMVKPDKVDDIRSYEMAREIKEKIESKLQYPGTIKITVIRETRIQEEAV